MKLTAFHRQWKKWKQSLKRWLSPAYNRYIDLLLARKAEYVPYLPGEKVRIVFLYQMPSFWPSWDTVLEALRENPGADVRLVLFDRRVRETEQTKGAEAFLCGTGAAYINYNDFDLKAFNPHIIVYQTPYDRQNRPSYLHAPWMRNRGYRVAYIPYGVESTKLAKEEHDQFENPVVRSAWRVYTFSEPMRKDYLRSLRPDVVKALGDPKLDRLYNAPEAFRDAALLSLAQGKKIVLWKMHFPFTIKYEGKETLVTPDLGEYVVFSEMMGQFSDLFFVVMPHPKFLEMSRKILRTEVEKAAVQIIQNVENSQNACLSLDHDYRPALLSADCFISDRSSIMILAGVTGKPVFYMSAKDFSTPFNQAVEKIALSYDQGNTAQEMIRFIERFRKGDDPKRAERLAAVKEGLPFLDGHSGKRVALDLIEGVKSEKRKDG